MMWILLSPLLSVVRPPNCRMTFILSVVGMSFPWSSLQVNFIKPPRPTFSFVMEREPCEQLPGQQPPSFSSLGSQRMPPPLPQTTPELEVTGERGWLPGRAVSMETGAPVGSRGWQVCWVWSPPGGLPTTSTGAAFPALVRVCSCPSLMPLFLSSCCFHLQTISRS